MAEELYPTVVPGMVGIKHKETGKVTQHFPVDVREILTSAPGKYEIVDNGAVEAARLNANPLKAAQALPEQIVGEVTGIEGQVMVAMTAEQAEAWKAKQADEDGKAPEGEKPAAPASSAKTTTSTANKSGDAAKAGDSK